jgi:hypothetical protein
MTQIGCYNWVAVKPDEAEKLSGSFVANAGPNALAIRVVHAEQPDGRMVELEGDFDVRLELKDGDVLTFSHPVRIEAAEDTLVFHGGDQEPAHVKRDNIVSLKASKYNMGETAVLVITLTAVAAAILVGAIVIAAGPTTH